MTSRLFWSNSVGLRIDLILLPLTAIDHSHFPLGIAVRTLLFGRIFPEFEDLGVVHVGDQILRFFAERVDLRRLAQVLKEGFLVLVVLELRFSRVVFCCSTAERGTPTIL